MTAWSENGGVAAPSAATLPAGAVACPAHPTERIVSVPRRLGKGGNAVLPYFVCTGGGLPHGLRVSWVEKLRAGLLDVAVPPAFEVRVQSVAPPSVGPPRVLHPLAALAPRELILNQTTRRALERVRRRIEHGPRAFLARDLAKILDPKLHAIFYGPPGTGKTEAFRFVTSGIVGATYALSLRDLIGTTTGDLGDNMRELSPFIERHARTPHSLAILIDDADDLMSSRGSDASAAGQFLNALKIAMLGILDAARFVPIVITTNRLASLDLAIHRRIVQHVEFSLPDAAARQDLLARFADACGVDRRDAEWDMALPRLVGATDRVSPAEIALAFFDAAIAVDAEHASARDRLVAPFTAALLDALADRNRAAGARSPIPLAGAGPDPRGATTDR